MQHRSDPGVISCRWICGTVVVLALFVWPTPYRYEKVTRELAPIPSSRGPHTRQQEQMVYRVNRLTGHSTIVVKTKSWRDPD